MIVKKILLALIGLFFLTVVNAQDSEINRPFKTNIQINNITDCVEPGGEISFDVTLRIYYVSDINTDCQDGNNWVLYNYMTTFNINGTQVVFNLNDIDLNTGSFTSQSGEFSVNFLDDDYDVTSDPRALLITGNVPALSMCDDFANNPCDNSDPQNPCPGYPNPNDLNQSVEAQRDLYFRVSYRLPEDILPGNNIITGFDSFDDIFYYKDSDNLPPDQFGGGNTFPNSNGSQNSIDNTFLVTNSSNAGLDQIGTANNTFVLDANTPVSTEALTCAGTWSGPSFANFSDINNPTSTVTFPTGTTGEQTLTWTINCGGCESFDNVMITLNAEGTVSGHLYLDTNGNGTQDSGEPNLPNVDVVVTDVNGANQTVSTNAAGDWIATVVSGSTTANVDESDTDFPINATQTEGTDPTIVTSIAGQNVDAGNDGYFQAGTISGNVLIDTDNDGDGNDGIENITIKLFRDVNNDGLYTNGVDLLVTTDVTDVNGAYEFLNLPPDTYIIVENQPAGYVNIKDIDVSNNGYDDNDINTNQQDDQIAVNLTTGEVDSGNNFIEKLGYYSISGNVFYDKDQLDDNQVDGYRITPLPQSYAVLVNSSNQVVAYTELGERRTPEEGRFVFTNIDGATNYRVLLSFSEPTINSIVNTASLPLNYNFTGENIGAGIGSDGNVDGISQTFFLDRNIDEVNFGVIYFLPNTTS